MKNLLILLAAIIVLNVSCNNHEEHVRTDGFTPMLETKEDSLFHDVMKGHDVAMAKMGQISKSITRLTELVDSLSLLKETPEINALKSNYQRIIQELKYADDGMFMWMDEFKADSSEDDSKARIIYLENEKVKVGKVSDAIFESLRKADSVLQH